MCYYLFNYSHLEQVKWYLIVAFYSYFQNSFSVHLPPLRRTALQPTRRGLLNSCMFPHCRETPGLHLASPLLRCSLEAAATQ